MSRALTNLPPRSTPRRPTEPAPIARWYPMELQPPLLPPLFPPHRIKLRKHLPLQPPRQERPQTLAFLTECPPSLTTWWISSPATERWHSSRTSMRQVVCGTCGTSASHAWYPVVLPAKISGMASKLSSPLPSATPHNPSPLYILRAFAQFLPALLMPCSRRGKPRHVSLNACRFQKGEWESLWNQTLKHNNCELAHRAKKLACNPPAPASIRARSRYAEYCAQ
jgi:hypothetical protein